MLGAWSNSWPNCGPAPDVALLRAYLCGRWFRTLALSLATRPWREIAVLTAAFHVAVHRRFGGQPRSEVMRYVAQVRIRRGKGGPNKLEPLPTVRVILESLAGTGRRAEGVTKWQNTKSLLLLTYLIEDENLTNTELEEFIAESVRMASGRRLLGKHERPPE